MRIAGGSKERNMGGGGLPGAGSYRDSCRDRGVREILADSSARAESGRQLHYLHVSFFLNRKGGVGQAGWRSDITSWGSGLLEDSVISQTQPSRPGAFMHYQ